MRKAARQIALFSCLHTVLALTFLLWAFQTTSVRFDTGARETRAERWIGKTAEVLFLPGSMLWTRWTREHFPAGVQWMIFGANSVLWGAVLAFLFGRATRSLHAP